MASGRVDVARQQRHVAPLRAMCFPIGDGLPWPTVVSGWNGDKAPSDWRSHHRTVAYRAQRRTVDGVRGQGRRTVLGIELKFGPVGVGVGHDVVVDNGLPVRLRATELHPFHCNVRNHWGLSSRQRESKRAANHRASYRSLRRRPAGVNRSARFPPAGAFRLLRLHCHHRGDASGR